MERVYWRMCNGECMLKSIHLFEYIFWRRVCGRMYNGECIVESG